LIIVGLKKHKRSKTGETYPQKQEVLV